MDENKIVDAITFHELVQAGWDTHERNACYHSLRGEIVSCRIACCSTRITVNVAR